MNYLFRPIRNLFPSSSRVWYFAYRQLDKAFREFDDERIQISDHLRLIPPARYRTGGQSSISEYAHSAGIISAYIGEYLSNPCPQILDIGCGTGKMVMAAWPFLKDEGRYTGIDVKAKDIRFAQNWYPAEKCSFLHADVFHPYYNPNGKPIDDYRWPIEPNSIDLAVAFSLFTHLDMVVSKKYFDELARVLKPNAFAILTFFLLDERYDASNFINTRWNFDRTIEGQPEWHWSSWFQVPERQIAVSPEGIRYLAGQQFKWINTHRGYWTGGSGAFLQDTLVFQKV